MKLPEPTSIRDFKDLPALKILVSLRNNLPQKI